MPKIGNHRGSSDMAFEFVKFDPSDSSDLKAQRKLVAMIRDRTVPVANQGEFRPSSVAREVSNRINRRFRVHHHTQAWKKYGVRGIGKSAAGCKLEYCQFDEVHEDYVYTQEWIDFLVKKLSDQEEYEALLRYRI